MHLLHVLLQSVPFHIFLSFFVCVRAFSRLSPVFSVLCLSHLLLFPTPLLFLSRRLKGPRAQKRLGLVLPRPGATVWGGDATGGEERALCLEAGRMVMCLNVGRRGPPIDRIRTRLAVLENYGSLSQEVRLKSQVTH